VALDANNYLPVNQLLLGEKIAAREVVLDGISSGRHQLSLVDGTAAARQMESALVMRTTFTPLVGNYPNEP
jgi:hypothetical protein